jgi:hypothetical protein
MQHGVRLPHLDHLPEIGASNSVFVACGSHGGQPWNQRIIADNHEVRVPTVDFVGNDNPFIKS